MTWNIGRATITLVQGDIALQQIDAIVNAANSALAPGSGVNGAIQRRGGPAILAETSQRYPNGCPTGSAVITGAGNLAARYVIHAVGPVYHGGGSGEADLLASAHRASLQLAAEHGCHGVAFPALSTGVFGYPLEQAARVALSTTAEFLRQGGFAGEVRFVLFDNASFDVFAAMMNELSQA